MPRRILPVLHCLLFSFALLPGLSGSAQTPATPGLLGTWEGSMMIGPGSYVLAFTLSGSDGNFSATFTSRDMGVYGMPATSVVLERNRIRIRVAPVDGEFTGTLRLDESGTSLLRIDGDWFQEGEMLPMTLHKAEQPSL